MKKYYILLLLVWVGTLAAQEKTFTPSGKFSGLMFGDYYYNFSRDASFGGTAPANAAVSSAAPGATAMQAFQFRRIYFTYDYDLAEQFTTRFRLEVDQAANASNGKIGAFVKDAFLRWKNIFSGSDLIFGIQPTPAYDVSEGIWGYRSLEKTIMDLRGIVPSRDQGLSLKGKVTDDGSVNYWVMFANNSANSPETDKYKRYYAHVQVKPVAGLVATAYFDLRAAADIKNKYNSNASVSNSATTMALFVDYAQPGSFSIGVEGFTVSTDNGYDNGTSLASRSTLGFSVFGNVTVSPTLAVVARYDNYDPNTDGNSVGDMRNYIIAGLDWKVAKNVSIIPNILYETYEAPKVGSAPDASLSGRLTFYYTF
jgi:hypothetical protein